MNEQLIKLAREKSFKSSFEINDLIPIKSILCYYFYMCELQKWLREKHNLNIYIDTTPAFDKFQPSKYRATVKVAFQPFKWTTAFYYLGDTYEESLEKGLQEALKLI